MIFHAFMHYLATTSMATTFKHSIPAQTRLSETGIAAIVCGWVDMASMTTFFLLPIMDLHIRIRDVFGPYLARMHSRLPKGINTTINWWGHRLLMVFEGMGSIIRPISSQFHKILVVKIDMPWWDQAFY